MVSTVTTCMHVYWGSDLQTDETVQLVRPLEMADRLVNAHPVIAFGIDVR